MTTLVALTLAPLLVGGAILLFDLVAGREPDWPIFWAALTASTVCFAILAWLVHTLAWGGTP